MQDNTARMFFYSRFSPKPSKTRFYTQQKGWCVNPCIPCKLTQPGMLLFLWLFSPNHPEPGVAHNEHAGFGKIWPMLFPPRGVCAVLACYQVYGNRR